MDNIHHSKSDNLLHFVLNNKVQYFIIIIFFSAILDIWGFYLSLLLFPVTLRFFKEYFQDKLFIAICSFSLLFSLYSTLNHYNDQTLGNILFYALYPPVFYLLGSKLTNPTSLYFNLLLMLVLLSFSSIIDITGDIIRNQFINPLRQITLADGSLSNSATLIGLNLSLCVSAVGIIFLKTKSRSEFMVKYVMMAFAFAGVVGVIHLLNRTGLVIAAISIFSIILYQKRSINASVLLLFLGGALYYFSTLFTTNTANVMDAYDDRNENLASGGGRTELWQESWSALIETPLGIPNLEQYTRDYAHNWWLDTWILGGILSVIALLITTILFVNKLIDVLVTLRNTDVLRGGIVLFFAIGFFTTLFVEPALEANQLYIHMLFFFVGIVSSLYKYKCWLTDEPT